MQLNVRFDFFLFILPPPLHNGEDLFCGYVSYDFVLQSGR